MKLSNGRQAEVLETFLWQHTNMTDLDLISEVAECLAEEGYRKQEWHKVSDNPPKTSGLYIVCTKKGSVCTAHFYADAKKFSSPAGKNAEYWTFMPEPPKGE